MKKIMSAILASAVIAAGCTPAFAANTFTDVTKDNEYKWAYDYVENMAEKGLIKGYEDGTFKAGKEVSRMEAFALFARLMGSNAETNAEFLESVKENYKTVLERYELSYAEGDVAYMLARGVITEDELDDYFAGDKKTQPMPRAEAAILITKAMLQEQAAKDEVLVDMDYTDVSSIPKMAKQYVYFVSQKGIMSGMGDGKFSPNTAVLRGQIAVMLSKTCDCMDYSFEKVSVVSVDTDVKNIKVKDQEGQAFTIGYTDDARFYQNGEMVVASKLKKGQSVVFTYVADGDDTKLVFADIAENKLVADETKAVVFKNYQSKGGMLIVNCLDVSKDMIDSYPCDSNVKVLIDGAEADINKLKDGYYVTIALANDTIIQISAMQKSQTIDAVIEKIGSMGTIEISSDDAEFNGITLSFAKDARFYKNGDTSDFASLCRGDKAKITLEYGVISKINSTSATKTVTGTLVSYTIAGVPTITISDNGKESTFDISPSASVKIGTEDAKLSDFVVGANLTLTVESDVVKKIAAVDATGTVTSDNIVGTITAKYDKLITVAVPERGDDFTVTITCSDSVTCIKLPTLENYDFKKVKIGDTITAYGSYKNGIFVSTGILVSPQQ